jgi:hypothetical protein
MTVLEFSRGWLRKRFGLAVVRTPSDAEALVAEMPQAKAALLQWFQDRGSKAAMVKFSVMAAPDRLDAYEAILRRVSEEEVDLAPVEVAPGYVRLVRSKREASPAKGQCGPTGISGHAPVRAVAPLVTLGANCA